MEAVGGGALGEEPACRGGSRPQARGQTVAQALPVTAEGEGALDELWVERREGDELQAVVGELFVDLVYAGMLRDVVGADPAPILVGSFDPIDVMRA